MIRAYRQIFGELSIKNSRFELSEDNKVIDETDLSNIVILFRNEWNQTTEKIEL